MDVLIRALVIFVFLWLVVRVSGKREVAQLSAFDMLLLVTVGDLVAQGVVQEDYSLTAALIAVATFSVAQLLLGQVNLRFPGLQPWIGGRARIVVRNGEPRLDVLQSEQLTLGDLHEAAREQGIRRLSDIEMCVLETDGAFSFFTRDEPNGQEGAPEDHEFRG